MYQLYIVSLCRQLASISWVTSDPNNELSPVWHQLITWTNADCLPIRPMRTNFSGVFVEVQHFLFKLMNLKDSSTNVDHFAHVSKY